MLGCPHRAPWPPGPPAIPSRKRRAEIKLVIYRYYASLCALWLTQAQIPRAGMPATWTPRYLTGLLTGEVRGEGGEILVRYLGW